MRRVYMARRDHLVDRLQRTFGDRIEVRPPSGGMALWVHVRLAPSKVVLWEKRALEQGVAFVAGERFAFDGRSVPFARIGFASLAEDEMREAVTRLERAFRR
jgi:GntR family transcriptional regulator/MocR family aminotransferase